MLITAAVYSGRYALDVVAMHEHDVVPVGAVHIQVNLPNVRGESSGPGL